MADELQALLNRINEEGLKKADEARTQLIAQAKAEADAIVAKAKEEADATRSQAKADAQILAQKGEEALRHAARDIMLTLRQQLQERVREAALQTVRAAMDAQQLPQIITDVVTNYLAQGGAQDDLQVLLNPEQFETLSQAVSSKLGESLKKHCTFAPTPSVASGFKLVFKDNDVLYDFSDEALADTVAAFVGPRIAAALK